MRVVAVADTHTFEADLGPIPDGDVFIHAGDLVRAGRIAELAPVVQWMSELPHRHKIVVAGNHDRCFQSDREAAEAALGGGFIYLQDGGVIIEGLSFWGSPWQPKYQNWAFNLPRGQALRERWSLIPDDVDVLITHGPPEGYGDRGPYPQRAGCSDLLDAVRRVAPALHLFGHIHTDGGAWQDGRTTFVNATTWECERAPTVVDVDERTRGVTLVEVPPARSR